MYLTRTRKVLITVGIVIVATLLAAGQLFEDVEADEIAIIRYPA